MSYVLERADEALAELLRVTKPGGRVLLTFMSLLGAARTFFGMFRQLIDEHGWDDAVANIFDTGILTARVNRGHVMKLYRWREVEALLGRHPCRLLAASTANFIVIGHDEDFARDERWLELELAACREPGALDAGTHIVAVVEPL
jgi:hypothetical protein